MLRAGALSRAAASRGLVPCSRAPGGLARAVGAVVAARGGRLRRRGGCGAESRCVPAVPAPMAPVGRGDPIPGPRDVPLSPGSRRVGVGAPGASVAPPRRPLRPQAARVRPQPLWDGGPGRVRQRVPPECDLLPAHLRGGLREAGGHLHGARAAPPLPQHRPQPRAGREGGAQGQAGGVRGARAPLLLLGASRPAGLRGGRCGGGCSHRSRSLSSGAEL